MAVSFLLRRGGSGACLNCTPAVWQVKAAQPLDLLSDSLEKSRTRGDPAVLSLPLDFPSADWSRTHG